MSTIDISENEIKKDVDLIMWSTKLSNLYRFTHQRFWEQETLQNEFALRIDGVNLKGEKTPRAESVAEHSWHIADIILIIGPRFPSLNIEKCLCHAILHDKLEIVTGDKNPIGRDGKGTKTHAFNSQKRIDKDEEEREALKTYLDKLNSSAKKIHKEILEDTLELNSLESKFVKALDKIHPLTYILRKKQGVMLDKHIKFTLEYSGTYKKFFPELEPYYSEIIRRLFEQISKHRNVDCKELMNQFYLRQLDLFKS